MEMRQRESSANGGGHDVDSTLMDSLLEVASRRNRHDILGSFCDRYLSCFLAQQNAKSNSPEAIFNVLVNAVDIREELHDMERLMDKNYFSELLAGGYFVYANRDTKTGLPIAWFRYGLAETKSASSEAGRRKYRAATPCSLAYLR